MNSLKDDIKDTLTKLELQIESRVREEQLRDQLTKLPNGAALNLTIRSLVEKPGPEFWVAFIEVDRFKSINDRFGYENADALLCKIADHLRAACNWFSGVSTAFRAHGDEFFLLGASGTSAQCDSAAIERSLGLVRDAIAAIKVSIDESTASTGPQVVEMTCTVSIGWLLSRDISGVQTDRRVLASLERAVGEAKHLEKMVRYAAELETDESVSLRTRCASCRCKFSFDVKQKENRASDVWCPNCGDRVERPPAPANRQRPQPPVETIGEESLALSPSLRNSVA